MIYKLFPECKDGRLERLNRIARLFCPFVLTMKRDRLTPSREIG